ncbi:uncharacterized protein LOC132731094, partial [Ruditapes philippinarum]|uniref:uncharacterized protein LOC132731094 n=1 Tax=Ruditapes philippinarum TaxID=129788 RepID=UPI00295B9EA2
MEQPTKKRRRGPYGKDKFVHYSVDCSVKELKPAESLANCNAETLKVFQSPEIEVFETSYAAVFENHVTDVESRAEDKSTTTETDECNSSDIENIYDCLHEEIRERNYENYCLAEEEQAEVIEEITEVIETAQISTSEKYKVSNDGECDSRSASKALFQGSPGTCPFSMGLGYHQKKPQVWSFLKPLYEELKVLETEGCECTDSNGKVFTSKCVLLTCTCDLPARALVYNCMQFNGSYSCWYCTDKGETYKFPTGGTCHVFPYNHKKPKSEPRTSETVKSDIASVCENIRSNSKNYIVRGHKGPFWFLYLKHFDAINSCVIDYMHGVCLGVMKTMLTLWFDKSNKDEYFSVFKSKNTVNNILQNIKPTIYVTRVPRSLDNLCHWKSSEFRNFLLYWGVPVLRHILNSDYFVHFCLLVRAIYLLSKENISDNDLKHAEGALLLFVECFQNLYGLRYYTLNLHQLVHLADCVTQTGPLFVNNCFIFEDLNGYIVKHIYGTQGIDNQLINISVMLKLYAELNDSVDARHTFQDEIEPGIRPIGTVKLVKLNEEEYRIASVYGIDNEN